MAAPKIITMLREIGVEVDELTEKILNMLERKDTISENVVAKKLKLKINEARKLLYRLSSIGLVTYTKQRDPDKKWWYLYYWSLDKEKVRELYVQYKRAQLRKKKQQLEDEKKFVFECKHCEKKFVYEDALETDFSCSDCGNILTQIEPTEIILKLEKEIENLVEEISRRERADSRMKTIKDKKRKEEEEKEAKKEEQKKKREAKKRATERAAKKALTKKAKPKVVKKKPKKKTKLKKKVKKKVRRKPSKKKPIKKTKKRKK